MPIADAIPDTDETISGLELRLQRVRHKLTATELGRRLGVSRQRVTAIEVNTQPSELAQVRYLAAIAEAVSER